MSDLDKLLLEYGITEAVSLDIGAFCDKRNVKNNKRVKKAGKPAEK